MKAYADAGKQESVLLKNVDRYIQTLPNDRDAFVIHPSEMAKADWCPRETWHRLLGHPKAVQPPLNLRSALIFDTGHSIHEKWQTWFQGMGVLWGRWYCPNCNMVVPYAWSNELGGSCHDSLSGKPHRWQYQEVPVRSNEHRIAGKADGVVDPGDDSSPVLLEVKSVGPGTLRILNLLGEDDGDDLSSTKFSQISHPSAAHIRQVQIYLRLMETWKDDLGPVTRAVVIYEHKADQQVREFVVERNDRWTDPLFEIARDITWAIERGREVACPRMGCKMCAPYDDYKAL